ncbi:RrF2 family transcriptional regulator [Tepidamorphus sp. 3E244]|uniref:RrF2 family transcriptional regulator n=1 Tax=Tepidamorphus sp. 3E244 TaxID=3385498 RepID=UPI0038FC0026
MLYLSRKSVLAIEAVVDIAHHSRFGPVPSCDFAERMGISRRHLEPVLQAMVREGILKSIRGPRGGYVLARERRRITIGNIVRAANSIRESGKHVTSRFCTQIIDPIVASASAAAAESLDSETLEDMLQRAEEKKLLPALKPAQDFAI